MIVRQRKSEVGSSVQKLTDQKCNVPGRNSEKHPARQGQSVHSSGWLKDQAV